MPLVKAEEKSHRSTIYQCTLQGVPSATRYNRFATCWILCGSPPEYIAALKAFASHSDVPLAEYVREMVHDHILQRGGAFRERGGTLRALINAGKAWVIAYHRCVVVARGLPGKQRHAELENLTWEAVKKAHEFILTKEAAKNAKPDCIGLSEYARLVLEEHAHELHNNSKQSYIRLQRFHDLVKGAAHVRFHGRT